MTELDKQIGCLTKLITDLPKADCENCDMSEDYCLTCCYERRLAEHLIDHGVIVPPCKIGDTVYRITFAYGKWEIRERECIKLSWFKKHNGEICWVICSSKNDILGDSVFLTKEEAEAALKEREQK